MLAAFVPFSVFFFFSQEGIETCYPQILPHDDDIRCPGACSPYAKYPRAMDKDLFYAA